MTAGGNSGFAKADVNLESTFQKKEATVGTH
jgi:hypothetical protein